MIADIYSVIGKDAEDTEYAEKMLHRIPPAKTIDRVGYILSEVKGKGVLNLGCASGELHETMRPLCKSLTGLDKCQPADIEMDLDRGAFPENIIVDLVVAGEILEHLSNPGRVLDWIRTLKCPLLITVPNAFCAPSERHVKSGIENVNKDHVCWYSWRTLKTLVERHGFAIRQFYWYKGPPYKAEGLIFLVN